MIRQAKCIGVDGDEDGEFSDLVGTSGKLRLDDNSMDSAVNWFDSFSSGGDMVGFARNRVAEKDGVVKVFTKFGNVFKFRLV
jgi:hypothetical protein